MSPNIVDITINPKVINPIYRQFYNKDKRTQIIMGGGSSGKSYSIMTFAVLWALEGKSILIVRKVAATLKHSAWAEVLVAISRLKLDNYFSINRSDKTLYCKLSGGYIMFKGIDNAEKLKSIRPMSDSAIDTVIVEEATEIYPEDYSQLLIRQRGITPFKKKIILLFNPIHIEHWIYKRWFSDIDFESGYYEDDDIVIIRTTYKDNKYLEKEDIKTLESFKYKDPLHYSVYCLGKWGVLGDKIFTNINIIDKLPKGLDLQYMAGLDFGWNDPTAYVLCGFDGEDIYILDEVYASKMDIAELSNLIRDDVLITADSEDPRGIAQLKGMGMSIKAAKKGAGSVLGGIMWLRRRRINVLSTCKHSITALENYSWEKDKKTGNSIDKPNHEFSHIPDALRYCFERYSRNKGEAVVGVRLKY